MIVDDSELWLPEMNAREKRAHERREQQKRLARRKEKEMDNLIQGSLLFCLPVDERMKILYDGLVEGKFISNDTKLEHFCVALGRYLHQSELPFVKIRWMKNVHLFGYFARSLYKGSYWLLGGYFFVNKYGEEIHIPSSDLQRLQMSADFDALKEIIQKYLNSV